MILTELGTRYNVGSVEDFSSNCWEGGVSIMKVWT